MIHNLSILDQAPICEGGTPADAIRETLRLAEVADGLGYHRYWMAEHHNSGALGCANPEVMVAQLASRTQNLRLGSGGVLLSLHSPLRVAESFRLLETLYPGRIDLGIGRAAGGDPLTTAALTGVTNPDVLGSYPQRLEDLLGLLNNDLPADHPFHRVEAMPAGDRLPQIWLLGSGTETAIQAARLGCAYCYAQFIHPRGGREALEIYRNGFQPSPRLAAPLASVCVMAQCADTEEEAYRLSQSRYLWVIRSRKRVRAPIPTIEEAESYPYDDAERTLLAKLRHRAIAGDPEQLRNQFVEMSRHYGVEELIVLTLCHDYEARLHSYELLAEALELKRPPAAVAAETRVPEGGERAVGGKAGP